MSAFRSSPTSALIKLVIDDFALVLIIATSPKPERAPRVAPPRRRRVRHNARRWRIAIDPRDP